MIDVTEAQRVLAEKPQPQDGSKMQRVAARATIEREAAIALLWGCGLTVFFAVLGILMAARDWPIGVSLGLYWLSMMAFVCTGFVLNDVFGGR